jgi:GT2 family glycosyltransferase
MINSESGGLELLDLTVIVPNYNTRELLRQCISSIYENTRDIGYEVVCIDDNSSDGSADMVAESFPWVRLVRNSQGKMYARNNNLGLRMSGARYACLLNSDTVLIGNAFKTLIDFMDSHPEAAACGPLLRNPDMSVQSCVRRFCGLTTMVLQGLNFHRIFPNGHVAKEYYAANFDYTKAQAVDSIGTTAYVIRRSTWEEAGMLDERLPHFQVDIAYNLMLKRKGYKVFFTPCAEVIHYGGQSINQMAKKKILELHGALADFNDYYNYFGSNWFLKKCVRAALWARCLIKLAEYELGLDKRVIKGPGAPSRVVRKA